MSPLNSSKLLLVSDEIMQPLIDFLSVGDVMRVLVACCVKKQHVSKDVVVALLKRMSIKVKPKLHYGIVDVFYHMGSDRCIECGKKTRATPRICECCTSDSQSRYAMLNFADVRKWPSTLPQGKKRELVGSLPVAKRGAHGTFYFWRKDVVPLIQPYEPSQFSTEWPKIKKTSFWRIG